MSAADMVYRPVATHEDTVRSDFVIRVYQHLALAVVAFVAFEALLINLGVAKGLWDFIAKSGSGATWLLILGGFMIVSWLATNAAHDVLNPSRQYLGLFALAAAWAVMFAPFLYYFFNVADNGTTSVIAAAFITAIGFVGLTGVAMVTRRDLSRLRPLVIWGMVSALVLIIAAALFGLNLGVWFSVAMIVLSGAAILWKTQTIMRNYPPEAYVGAAVQLFASVMLMFWYVLRLVGAARR